MKRPGEIWAFTFCVARTTRPRIRSLELFIGSIFKELCRNSGEGARATRAPCFPERSSVPLLQIAESGKPDGPLWEFKAKPRSLGFGFPPPVTRAGALPRSG